MTRVVAVGELLLRLRAPGAERLLQTPALEATFGGAEFNVLASLARFGHETEFVTALPSDAIGAAAVGAIRQHGVGHAHVVTAAGRLGLYFLETGNGARPARVIYDRAGSVFARAGLALFDWPRIVKPGDCLHLTGITPAVGETAAAIAVAAADAAIAAGARVSLDINLRPQLWRLTGREPFTALEPLLRRARILFATPDDWQACFGSRPPPSPGSDRLAAFGQAIFEAYPGVELLVAGQRRGGDAASFELGATAWRRGGTPTSGRTVEVRGAAERIGSGDALVAGCLHGILSGWPDARWLEFALMAQALKHTVPGDVNLVSASEVEAALESEAPGRVIR